MKPTRPPDTLTISGLTELASFQGLPCLSLYQPTQRHHPGNQQDPIRFRQLVKALDASARAHGANGAADALIEPFDALAQDRHFWNHTLDGLAVLGAPGLFRVYLLQRSIPEMAQVADHFHTKPLRQWLQSFGRYQVLALSRHRVRLYEGDQTSLDEVPLAVGVPQTLAEMPGAERTDPHSTVSSYGGIGQGHMDMHHGHGGPKDKLDADAERFFRAVDRAVLEHHSHPSGLPLMLAALPEHHHLFHQVSHNPFLMEAGVMADPQSLTPEALRQHAWDAAAPQQEAQHIAWRDAHAVAMARGLASEDLSEITRAALSGRVATLLIEAERALPGRMDRRTGRMEPAEGSHPSVNDLLDDLSELVEKMGGRVHVLTAERMPCATGAAASFRH